MGVAQEKPLVTFVVSAFNRPKALNLCLLSLILQVEENWEAIVTDNSTDPMMNAKHKDVCRIDSRIRYLYTADVAGICCYDSANYAVQFAKGEWLGFPSDDAYFTPEYAAKLLRKAKEDDLELVYSDLVMTGPNDGGVLDCKAMACHIDKINFLIKKSKFIPFPRINGEFHSADGWLIAELVARGIREGKVGHPLAVHNCDRKEL